MFDTGGNPGPFGVCEFKCSDGSPSVGVVCEKSGAAVAWCNGKNIAQEYANARNIAAALNQFRKLQS